MCSEDIEVVKCREPVFIKEYALTELVLDCWQREYDRRPYTNFIIHRKVFEARMHRVFNLKDFIIIIDFLSARCIKSIQWLFLTIPNNEYLESFISTLGCVENLELVNVDLPVEFLRILSEQKNFKLKTLRIPGNPLTEEHIEYLRIILINSRTLRCIDVSHCSINENLVSLLAEGVCQSLSCTTFIINNIERHDNIYNVDSDKLGMLISIIIWKNTLTKLEFQNCSLTAHDMEPICEYLSRSDSCLVELNLAGNRVATDGTRHLFDAIIKSRTLQKLDISINGLGPKGGEIIAHSLCRTTLLELKLCKNNIDAETINLILLTIKKIIPIRLLHISGNKFNAKSGEILNRLIQASVILTSTIDVRVVFKADVNEFEVLSHENHYSLNLSKYCVASPEDKNWPKCLP